MTYGSVAGTFTGTDNGFAPCTAEACMELLDYYGVELQGAPATVIGASMVIGKPIAMMLLNRFATVTVCHIYTKNTAQHARGAKVLISAAGCAGLVTKDFVNPNQIVVDVGINRDKEGNICGDCNFAEVEPLVRAITPVPGGVGTITTSILAKHVVEAAENKA